jgi:hypothetical protein
MRGCVDRDGVGVKFSLHCAREKPERDVSLAFVVVENELLYPVEIGLFRVDGVVFDPDEVSGAVEKLFSAMSHNPLSWAVNDSEMSQKRGDSGIMPQK